jgi:hypothetical protein
MSELQRLLIQEGNETYEIYVEAKDSPPPPPPQSAPPTSGKPGEKGAADAAIVKMQQARQMIRGYAMYALSAFKDFGAAEVEEVTLKFGLKIGGKAGIPYITEGKAESNLEIEVKCKFSSSEPNSSP